MTRLFMLGVIVALLLVPSATLANDDEMLRSLLDDFLHGASVGSVEAHERFWADELVYTSSAGTRTNKAAIVDGMRGASGDSTPTVIYTAADVDVRIYGETAIVAFRLVGTPTDEDSGIAEYFNTGTFLKRDGEWRAIAWQATRIPATGAGD